MGDFLIFRLQDGTDLSGSTKHWDYSSKYDDKQINAIVSSNTESITEPTSIPSPFARIDLAKTAFRIVAKEKEKASKIHIKTVSDCLDVAEIFFNADKLRDKIEILVWDKTNDLPALIKSHPAVGKTMDMFLKQDAKSYNFDRLQRIYLLNYIGPGRPNELNIIGATSPATLFFAASNDKDKSDKTKTELSFVAQNIQFGQDKPFDNQYQPLHKRDFEFIKYIFAFQKSINDFASDFPEFYAYLIEYCYPHLTDDQKRSIDLLDENSINAYDTLFVTEGENANYVEIIGRPFHKKQVQNEISSDFEVVSSIYKRKKPLVLPINTGNNYTSYKYTQSNWGDKDKAPVIDKRPLEKRTLPFTNDVYPYLTISDLLEDTIIRMPYEFNSDFFFDGNLENANRFSFLLPLSEQFFNFFTTEQLMSPLPGGKNMIDIKSVAGGVTVTLRIPVKKGQIEYQRTYYEKNIPKIDANSNDGAVVVIDFAFALFPLIHFERQEDAHYRLGLISAFNEMDKFKIKCFSDSKSISFEDVIRNNADERIKKCKTISIEKNNFDFIQINYSGISGIITPIFCKQGGSDQFTFAVDLGTTNTFIEGSINGNPSSAFTVSSKDSQINLLTQCEQIEQYIFDYDLIPQIISSDEEFYFPMRTALSEGKNTNWSKSVIPLSHVNIPFPYEKRSEYEYNRVITDLKWSNEVDKTKKIKTYIECLMFILRNKVLLNKGNLSKTKIIWFYPISMTRNRVASFKEEWEKAYTKYFGDDLKNIIPITESVAPYEFFKGGLSSASNIVTIDIGGGTTDILIAEDREIKFITSFRFAADALFGDAFSQNQGSIQNGIIRQFKRKFVDILSENKMDDLLNVLSTLNKSNISSNIATFLFSLKHNKKIKEKGISDDVDFNKLLGLDKSQKIVFIFFYAAIIYHLASIMKAKNLKMPRHLAFSGNGSKAIQILTQDSKLLEEFTILIFEKIYGQPYNPDGLSIIHNTLNPKEATCKGGISNQVGQEYSDIEKTKAVLLNHENGIFVKNEKYKNINNDDTIIKTVEEVKKYIEFTFELNNQFSFKNNFGSDHKSFELAKNICFKDLEAYTKNGLTKKLEEASLDDPIEETLFFYPIIGMLNALTSTICGNSQ